MPVSESSPAISITSITFQAANCHPRIYLSGRPREEKLTTLTNLNFDSIPRRNVQWFIFPSFLPVSLATSQAIRLQDSGG
jgi:hypothetical protein